MHTIKHSKEARYLISLNNGNKLSNKEINKRTLDYILSSKRHGYISELAKKWNISHTSVKRFINKYCKDIYNFGEYYQISKNYECKDEQIEILEENLAYTHYIMMRLKEQVEEISK